VGSWQPANINPPQATVQPTDFHATERNLQNTSILIINSSQPCNESFTRGERVEEIRHCSFDTSRCDL